LVYDPYDPCPDGTKPAGGYIAQSQSADRKDWRRLQYAFSTHGRRYDSGGAWNMYEGNGPRACVGNHLGTYSVYRGNDDSNISEIGKRRVGKEGRSRWRTEHEKKKKERHKI